MRFLINGIDEQRLPAEDRGLAYGDGVFRTFRLRFGRALHWELQHHRLESDCAALGLKAPDAELLASELLRLGSGEAEAVGKIIVTRGVGARGYDPGRCGSVTRLVGVGGMPDIPRSHGESGVRIHVCQLRLADQPRLAGIKHLNRLENVLARGEWDAPEIAEGLLLDKHDRVVEGTMSNLFLVHDGALLTPDLTRSGVAGVQRARILASGPPLGYEVRVRDLGVPDVLSSDEAFLVNSVIGLWPIRALGDREWTVGPVTRRIAGELFHELA